MSKKIKSILETEIDIEPTLAEECQKYGIEYHEPFFEPMLSISKDGNVYIGFFYLQKDLAEHEDFAKAVSNYNLSLFNYVPYLRTDWLFIGIKSYFRFSKAVRVLNKLEKKYNIQSYTQNERNKYIEDYRKGKEQEVKKAKALVEVAKAEMKLEK